MKKGLPILMITLLTLFLILWAISLLLLPTSNDSSPRPPLLQAADEVAISTQSL
ncbi:MAG: hypothetical protein JJU31_08515 [Wenzhouxiangella sp.]|nr:hypothetical protein [Wenzhouxiangella sp.]